jgi:hypothetical protein
VKVQVTFSPAETLIALTGLPSLQDGLAVHKGIAASLQLYVPAATLTGPFVLGNVPSASSSSEKLPIGAEHVKLKSWA